jgi:hypothetical protein
MKDSDGNFIYEENSYEYELDENGNKVQATDEDGNLLFETDSEGNKVPVYKYASAYNETTGRYEKIPIIAQKDPEDIAWQLNADGSGWLANHNISWESDGDITLSDKVTIKWGQVDGGQGAVDAAKNEAINTAGNNTDSKVNSAKTDLEGKINSAKTELNNTISTLNTTFGSQLNTVKQEVLTDAQDKVNDAIDEASTNLNKVKTALEQKIAKGESDITTLTSELDSLSEEIDALDALNTSIQSRLDGHDSVLSEENLKDIASAALIEGTTITGDSISSENVMATKIVGLVADFGTVKAANIQGDTISGKTIQSTTIRNNTDINNGKPAWKINNSGKITIIDENGNKSEIGGDDIIKIFDTNNEEYLTLNNLGLNFGENTSYRGDRIHMTNGSSNNVIISPRNGSVNIKIGMCEITVNTSKIDLTAGDYTIALSNNGIEFYGLEPGYLYVDENCQLTTKTSTIKPSYPLA